jgi:hypothetical protein
MKVSKRDISIVMVLLGVIALFCVYQFYYRDSQKKVEELQKSIDNSTAENNELLKIDETKLNNEMIAGEARLKEMVQQYPARYRLDDTIMYMYDLEQRKDDIGVHFFQYTMEATNIEDSFLGAYRDKSVVFGCGQAKISAEFTTETYAGCKQLLKEIYADSNAKNFSKIQLTYDNLTGVVNGIIDINLYSVSDYATLGQGSETNFPQAEVMIPQVSMGVDCVFGPTVTPKPTLAPEDEQQTE